MRVAFYGGSFNPPHIGHALVAAWLLWTDQVDAVWLVPVGAHAFGKNLAPFERRRGWCEALAQTLGSAVRVESIERELTPPTYTIRTLESLSERHPEHRFRLVIGADNLPHLPRWHRWDELAATYDPIVVGRAGYDSPPDVPQFPGISSSDVRTRAVEGRSLCGLVPAAVARLLTADDIAAWSEAG